jgi:hypothetical protein
MRSIIHATIGGIILLTSCKKQELPSAHNKLEPQPLPPSDNSLSRKARDIAPENLISSDIDPIVQRTKIVLDRVTLLASQDVGRAIAACNEFMLEIDILEPDGSRKYPPELFRMLSGKLRQAVFGPRCLFDSEDSIQKLYSIAKSDLERSVKDDFLALASAATNGDSIASARVLKAAIPHTSNPDALAAIVTDVAATAPQLAIQELFAQPWKPYFSKATARLYATYVMNDPENGSKAVNELPKDSPAYQWAAAGIFQAIRGAEPEAGATWRSQISNPEAAAFADSFTYMMKVER